MSFSFREDRGIDFAAEAGMLVKIVAILNP
jgi:hypothetical protein